MKHIYEAHLVWDGNLGRGTSSYTTYSRDYHVRVDGKPELRGSADPMFRGVADRYNPEDLFLAALSGCHMLSYLALCARRGVRVLEYEDHASGVLTLRNDGGGQFESVTLSPRVTIAPDSDLSLAMALHEEAHATCYVAGSCRTPITVHATCRATSLETLEPQHQ
jgi:organic hydroperoxide reductase OsmC/OhrA